MRISKTLILMSLVLCQIAVAQIETIVRAVETAPVNIRLPSSDGGTLVFKPCAYACDADYIRITLSAITSYKLNGKRVRFDEFRQSFMLRHKNDESYALVTYDVESKYATAIEFSE